jgi:NADP-dependent 3-hydroxy acid dehydrogenase YdfG
VLVDCDNPEGAQMNSNRPLAVVTGASSGIGYALAQELAQRGYDLVVAAEDRDIGPAAQRLASTGVAARPVQVDLAEHDGVEQLCQAVRDTGRPVDALALNAGVGVGGDFARDNSLGVELNLLKLDVLSPVHLAKRLLPDMVDRGQGRVLVTSSIAATTPGPFEATYAASKAFLLSFAEASPQRAEGQRRHGHRAHAWPHRHGFLRAGQPGGHQARAEQEGRPGRGRPRRPLLAQLSPVVPYVLVVVDRLGADIRAHGAHGAWSEEVDGRDWPVHKGRCGRLVRAALPAQGRGDLAGERPAGGRRGRHRCPALRAGLLVVAGEVRARAELTRALDERCRGLLATVEAGGRADGADEQALRAEVDRLVAQASAGDDEAVLSAYREELGQRAYAVTGTAATVAALRRGQVEALLLADDPTATTTAWVGPEPVHVALAAGDLAALGSASRPRTAWTPRWCRPRSAPEPASSPSPPASSTSPTASAPYSATPTPGPDGRRPGTGDEAGSPRSRRQAGAGASGGPPGRATSARGLGALSRCGASYRPVGVSPPAGRSVACRRPPRRTSRSRTKR